MYGHGQDAYWAWVDSDAELQRLLRTGRYDSAREVSVLGRRLMREPLTVASFAALEALHQLRDLSVRAWVTDDSLAGIARIQDLEVLSFDSQNSLTATGFACLSTLTKLRALNTCHVRLDDGILSCVAKLKGLRQLISYAAYGVTDMGFAGIGGFGSLESLELHCGRHLTDDAFAHLRSLKRLQRLTIQGANQLTGRCLTHLAGLPVLRNVFLGNSLVTIDELRRFRRRWIWNPGDALSLAA